MDLTKIYDQITNSALFGSALMLIAIALWMLVFHKMEKSKK
jgi:hypothetical protein